MFNKHVVLGHTYKCPFTRIFIAALTTGLFEPRYLFLFTFRLSDIFERLEDLDADRAETKAAEILDGLGFTPSMQQTKTKDFSGGWRMRIALARALFVKPTLLLLDEPTNHLDLDACVWLEEELKR